MGGGGGGGSSLVMEQELIHARQFHSKYKIRKSIQTGYGIYYMYMQGGVIIYIVFPFLYLIFGNA